MTQNVADGENAAQDENTGVSEPTVESLSKKYGAQAKAYVRGYNLNAGQDIDRFDSAFALAYNMGKSGVSFDYVKKSAAIGNDLTDAQKELAYNAGKEAADVEARNNYLRNVLQSKKKGGTINENDIGGGINNAEQQAENKFQNEGKSESRIAGSNERALSEDGNGRGVSEENGENRQSSEQIVHLQSGRRGLNQTEKRFSEDSFIVPREGTAEAEEYRKLSEYGIEGYVVKKSAWDRNVQAFSRGGKIYIREELDEIYRGIAVPHEATHVMKHLRYQPYLDFIDRTPLMLNMASDIAKSLINAPATHYNIDIFDMNERQRILIYDEINATAYGSYVGGQIVGELKEQINDAFYDFDAYINELSAIHEQFKKENTSARPEGKKAVRRRGFVKSEGVKLSELKKAFNDTQNKAYKILDTIARVTGVNIVLYKSDVDADGNFIGKQGKFKWSNDTIYIDINAGLENKNDVGDLAKYTMLRTFSHEFSHFIEKWNPIQYNELRRAIFNELTARGADVDELITNKLAEDSTGKMTYEEASREVVAEALTDILPDSSFIETLANKHKNVFNKLLSKLKEFIADIKAYFKRIGSEQVEEANKLKEEMNGALHYVESIVKLFDKAAVDAVENYQAATPKTDTDGKVQNQERYTKAPIFDVHATLDSVMDKVSAEDIAAGIEKAKNKYKVTDDEYFSVESYVRGRAYDLTRLQRAGETAEWGEMETYLADNIKSGLLKHPTYSGRTYRNLDFGTVFNSETDYEDFIRENAVGNEVTLNAFTSASKNPNGYPVVGDKVVHLVIDGLSARDISETFGLGQEEVIYLPGTKYKVTKVTTANDGHILIYGEEIATNEVQELSGGTEGSGLYRSHEAVSEGHRNDTRGVERVGGSEESVGRSGEIQNERSDGVYGETFGGLYEEINKTKITAGMSDSERAEILKNKVINAPMYEGQADSLIVENESKLESKKIEFAREAILEIADKLDILGKQINFKDIEVKIQLSKSNLKESVVKDATPKQIAKLLPILSKTAENAVVIERHNNRYYYDTDTVYFDNLLSGYVDGDDFVPVRFGLKHSRTGTTTLYVLVDQNKVALKDLGNIKKDDRGPQDASPDLTESDSLHRSVTYSISQIIPFVNSKDLLRYIPDDFLNTEQLKAKREAVAETEKYTYEKNDKKYSAYVEKGLNDTAKQMLSSKAKAEGYEKINAEEVYNSAEDRVKLTDVTYDDEGNLIPISKRYDSSDPDVRYRDRTRTLTVGDFIKMAGSGELDIELTDAEKDFIRIYKKKVDEFNSLKDQSEKLGKLYSEQQFGKDGKKPNRDEAVKTLNRKKIIDGKVEKASLEIMKMQDSAKVLPTLLEKTKKG